jgi:hypothetical protein
MPNKTESARNYEVEDALQDSVEGNKTGILALIVTGESKVEWNFYSSDKDNFMRTLNETLRSRPNVPLKIVFSDDPTWAEYTAVRSGGKS